jgi:NTE family protein
LNRVNEVSFNNALLREINSISLVSKLIAENKLKSLGYREIYLHIIEAEEIMSGLGASSKFNADWDFFDSPERSRLPSGQRLAGK